MEKVKNKKKQILIIGIMLIITFLFSGCGVNQIKINNDIKENAVQKTYVQYGHLELHTGQISQSIEIPLNKVLLGKEETESQQLKFLEKYNNIVVNQLQTYANNNSYSLTTNSTANTVTHLVSNTKEKVNLIQTILKFNDSGNVSYSISFQSVKEYEDFNSISSNEKAEETKSQKLEKGFFFYTVSKQYNKKFTRIKNSLISQQFLSLLNQIDANEKEYIFTYYTQNAGLRSNANKIRIDSKQRLFAHDFFITNNMLLPESEKPLNILFYVIGVNTTGWYVLALILTIIFVMILLLIKLINKNKEKKFQLTQNKINSEIMINEETLNKLKEQIRIDEENEMKLQNQIQENKEDKKEE